MKIGTLTFEGCAGCDNYDPDHDWCNLEQLNIEADGEDVVCKDFRPSVEVEA